MKKIIIILKLILRSKFFFKTPEKCDLVVFDETSMNDLKICLSKFNFFVLQTRLPTRLPSSVNILASKKYKIYFSYKILKKILKNYFKGNLFTVYLVSLIELIDPKVVITTIDISFKFSDITKILEKKINFIAIQNALEHDFLDWNYLYETKKIKQNLVKKFYIPNLFCVGDHDKKMWKQLDVKVNNFHPIGNLRLANFFHHIKAENNFPAKYNCDICLISEEVYNKLSIKDNLISTQLANKDGRFLEEGLVKVQKYTIKFCLEHNMKLLIPLKRDKKYSPSFREFEIEYFERNFEKEELDYIKRNILEKNDDNFSSYRALLNSKVAVGLRSTLLRNKLSMGGKILSSNLTKIDRYNFPVNGICTLNNCSYEEFEKRLFEIYSISKEDYFSRIDKNWNSLDKFSKNYSTIDKFSKNYSTIDLIEEKLSQLGVNQNF